MLITKEKLKELGACKKAVEFFKQHYTEIEEAVLLKDVLKYKEEIRKVYREDVYNWCYWLIAFTVPKEEAVRFAVYAAEQVLHIFEEKYPEDMMPRKAITAAKAYLENPNEDTRAANATWEAANAAANAAWEAAWEAANAAAYTAAYAAAEAAKVATDADPNIKDQILVFGIKLL